MTFAAPTPDLLRLRDRWSRSNPTAGVPTGRPLPPPGQDASASPGPVPWLRIVDAEPLGELPQRRVCDVVTGREVTDAFELIWPTGEIDEQFLGGSLSEMPPPGEPYTDASPAIDASPAYAPMTVRLRPLTAPPEAGEWPGPARVSEDVVLAIQRAIAAVGSDLTLVDEPCASLRSAERSTGSVAAATRTPASGALEGDRVAPCSPADLSDPTDVRRSALKRLINGLRRR